MSDQLAQELAASGLKEQTEVRLESDGLHITLASSILFASGSAEITDTTRQSLDLLSDSLKKLKTNKIVIAGHTDNVPEKGNGRYQSNWDLSSARAITVMEYFISKGAVLEKMLPSKPLPIPNRRPITTPPRPLGKPPRGDDHSAD